MAAAEGSSGAGRAHAVGSLRQSAVRCLASGGTSEAVKPEVRERGRRARRLGVFPLIFEIFHISSTKCSSFPSLFELGCNSNNAINNGCTSLVRIEILPKFANKENREDRCKRNGQIRNFFGGFRGVLPPKFTGNQAKLTRAGLGSRIY